MAEVKGNEKWPALSIDLLEVDSEPTGLYSLREWNSIYEAQVRIDLDRCEDVSNIASLFPSFRDFRALVPHPPPTTGIA